MSTAAARQQVIERQIVRPAYIVAPVTVPILYCNERTASTRSFLPCLEVSSTMMIAAALLFAEPDFTALDVLHEYIGFVGSFFIVGAASFYFLLMRPALGTNAAGNDLGRAHGRAHRVRRSAAPPARACDVDQFADGREASLVGAALGGSPASIVAEVMTVIAVIAFGLAATATRESKVAWVIAGSPPSS